MRPNELQIKLIPELRRHGIRAESVHVDGPLDESERSSVFSVTIDHRYYVIKLYHIHANFVRDLRNYHRLPNPPQVLMAMKSQDTKIGYDFIITKVAQGRSMNSNDLTDTVAVRLGQHMLDHHRVKRSRPVSVAKLHNSIDDTVYGSRGAAGSKKNSVDHVVDSMHKFLEAQAPMMRVTPSLLHNDIWWDNIIVAREEVYLVDWEWMKVGDYVEDLAYPRVMLVHRPIHNRRRQFWQNAPDEAAANRFFRVLVDLHASEFDDTTIEIRLKFYLALMSLRRLSDYAAGTFGDFPEARDYWLQNLPIFWERGIKD